MPFFLKKNFLTTLGCKVDEATTVHGVRSRERQGKASSLASALHLHQVSDGTENEH